MLTILRPGADRCQWSVPAPESPGAQAAFFDGFDPLRRDTTLEAEITGRTFELGPMTSPRTEPVLGECLQLMADDLGRREAHIHSDPDIMGGVPVIRGTRIPVQLVLSRIADGDSLDDLVADYPEVPLAAFEAANTYARTHPRPGRRKRPR